MENNELNGRAADGAEGSASSRRKLTTKEWGKKILLEFKDLLIGAAFPFMLTLILSATIISYVAYGGEDDLGLKIVVLLVGEAMIIAATVIFGKQNGSSAYKKTVQNGNKRKVNSNDLGSKLYIGEYSLVKGVLIPLISCIPFAVFLIVEAAFHNDICEFALMYVFGWAFFPFKLAGLSAWLALIWIIPFAGVHLAAYVWGGKVEKRKQDQLAAVEEIKDAKKKK
ncbi:MAG: hypothetical protein K2O89_05635 [Clostridia bacterium]|nr:hypothetical protein [Clostridia bacterium]